MADDADEEFEESGTVVQSSKFVAVVEAIDQGDRAAALKLLNDVQFLGPQDVVLLRDLLDEDKSYSSMHPYRLEVVSRAGAGKPRLPAFSRLEEDLAVRNAVRGWEAAGKNRKTAIYLVAQQRGVSDASVEKAYRRAGKKLLFQKKKHTK
ncbi:hypothetical protein [Devosia psychrophila]|uniref:Uncharacterized protein n=1 Tax=Devosia psychrophila TaxID=728005 RepID=A0A0F5PVN3_9HYPH|nr:hypothetical protein [Devosia psychrophila]KKC32655.1 hypothetical protein WH91_12555 [Devosia psychrophila]SFC51306.1 hypothetical protein SAMN04488059_10666 [Devosia psychrophila]